MPTIKCLKCNREREPSLVASRTRWWCESCLDDPNPTCQTCSSSQEVKVKFYTAMPPMARCKDCWAADNEPIWKDRDYYYNLARAEDIRLFETLGEELEKLNQLLATEREATQEALRTSQEWHERQKAEIIAEWKEKLTNLIQQRKASIHQEITLLKGILENSHDQ